MGDTGSASSFLRETTSSTLLFPAAVGRSRRAKPHAIAGCGGDIFFLHLSPLRASSTLSRCDTVERCSSTAAGLLAGLVRGAQEVHLVPPMDGERSPEPPLPRSSVRLGSPSLVRVAAAAAPRGDACRTGGGRWPPKGLHEGSSLWIRWLTSW